jgi:hypothetical protein
MKKFNQIVQVSFSVDTVATMILDKISPEFAHRELLVESIIAPLIINDNGSDRKRLGHVISALFGHEPKLDFEIGQEMYCKDNLYINGDYVEIGPCKVIEVAPFRDSNQVKIEFVRPVKGNTESKWVSTENLRNLTEQDRALLERRDDCAVAAAEEASL